jgi:hypothetical protein
MANIKGSGLNSVFGETKTEKIIEKKNKPSNTTLQINIENLEKMRAIAYWDRVLLKDIVNTALSEYIEQYESKNGTIKVAPTK